MLNLFACLNYSTLNQDMSVHKVNISFGLVKSTLKFNKKVTLPVWRVNNLFRVVPFAFDDAVHQFPETGGLSFGATGIFSWMLCQYTLPML